ncbi:MAG: hypothetical protein K8L97_25270 [Anaerolineae bacterium]|nr:hypothetical protein [Anaerolineae bacterium]
MERAIGFAPFYWVDYNDGMRIFLSSLTVVIIGLLLAGCGGAVINSPNGTAVAQVSTPIPLVPRATLPPTWTPTDTPSPEPPTATPTKTVTPSLTPTLSAETICAAFEPIHNLALTSGRLRYFGWDNVVTIFASTPATEAKIQLTFQPVRAGEGFGVELPGGEQVVIQIPLKRLGKPGQYDWTLRVQSESYGELCTQSGTFVLTGSESTRADEREMR